MATSEPMFVKFDFGEDLSPNQTDYYSRVPTVEVYRYSDNEMVKTLAADNSYSSGVRTGIFFDFDKTAMYLKLIAPSARLITLTSC